VLEICTIVSASSVVNSSTFEEIFIEQKLGPHIEQKCATAEDGGKAGIVPGLLYEVARASAHGLDGQIHAAPGGHDDHGKAAVESLQAIQQIEPSWPEVVSRV
jgi:hypothetical protein